MARRGINKEKVFAAADRLAARGEAVTVTRLREEVGNTGSYTTISSYLKAWRADSGGDDPEAERLPDGVEGGALQLVRRLWGGLAWLVDRRDAQRKQQTEAHFDRLEHEVGDTERALQDLAGRQREQEQALEELRRRDADRAEAMARLEGEAEALRRRLAALDGKG